MNRPDMKWNMHFRNTHNDRAISWATVQLVPAAERRKEYIRSPVHLKTTWNICKNGQFLFLVVTFNTLHWLARKSRFRFRWKIMKNLKVFFQILKILTPECTKPTLCHHDPLGSSGTCMWCMCPKPMLSTEVQKIYLVEEGSSETKGTACWCQVELPWWTYLMTH